MANRNYSSQGKIYSMRNQPVMVDCNFVVDSTNGNGLGIRSLKGPVVQNVFMHTTATPGQGNSNYMSPNVPVFNPNPVGSTGGTPPGGLNLASAASFGILAYSAITGSTGGGSTIAGNMGIYPNNGSSVTNFPPSTYTGTLDAANSIANQAMIDATAAFTSGQTQGLAGSTLPAELGGTTVTPGAYQFTGGSAGISLTSGHSTLTFNGAGVYIFYTASTLTTGASGSTDVPTFAFTGGATSSNTYIYWIVGSSATINQSVSSSGATFYGTVIAQVNVTATQPGTINGHLFALTGAVTLSNTNTLNLFPQAVSGGGAFIVQLQDAYHFAYCGCKSIVSPVSGTSLKIDNSALTAGTPYIITTLGNSTAAQWQALGLPNGIKPAVGASFIANSVGAGANTSTSRVMTTAVAGSGITTIETIGDPNQSIAPDLTKSQGFGAQFILQCRNSAGQDAAPADGTVISLMFYLSNSKVDAP